MPDEPDPEDEVMPCSSPGCAREVTHSLEVWRTPTWLEVIYYCPEHAPADATTFEEDEAECKALRELEQSPPPPTPQAGS